MPLNSHLDKQTLTDSSMRTGEEEEEGKVGISTPKTKQHRFVKSVCIYICRVSPSYAGSFGLIWVKETQVIPGLSGLSSQMQLQFVSM
jgi:putative AlgH/UPF0301 family transcriptional regulator